MREVSIEVGTVVGVSWLFGQVSTVWALVERVAGGGYSLPESYDFCRSAGVVRWSALVLSYGSLVSFCKRNAVFRF